MSRGPRPPESDKPNWTIWSMKGVEETLQDPTLPAYHRQFWTEVLEQRRKELRRLQGIFVAELK